VLSNEPKMNIIRWLKNAVSKIRTIRCDNSETLRRRMSVTSNH